MKKINIGIIGATGSVGKSALEIISKFPNKFKVNFLASFSNYKDLACLAKKVNSSNVTIINNNQYDSLKNECNSIGLKNISISQGKESVIDLIKQPQQVILIANNGVEALDYILECILNNQVIILANKEALVSAGNIINKYLNNSNAKIIPADSEHNAIYQLLDKNETLDNISEIIITASGGPFYNKSINELKNITKKEAVNHPTWNMGEIISVNSATLVNKALEIIEAHYLFNIDESKIKAVYHPQSLIHGIIKYSDGSVSMVAYKPNMQVALAYALSIENRLNLQELHMSILELNNIIVEEIKLEKIKPISLAKEVIKKAGNAPCVFNVANEVAVNAFLLGKIKFLSIINIIEYCLNKIPYNNVNTVLDIYKETEQVKNIAIKYINSLN